MLMKYLLPKCSAILGNQGKTAATLWRYTVRRYGDDSVFAADERVPLWNADFYTCRRRNNPHSPIDIDTRKVSQREYTGMAFYGYDKPDITMMLGNTGKLVKIDFPYGDLTVSGGSFKATTYKADHLHFHWGRTSQSGSEHYINGRRFPMEMHIVHYNTLYSDLLEAEMKPLGLCVFAFLFELSYEDNDRLKPIIQRLPDIANAFTEIPVELPSMMSILPDNLEDYYQYFGDDIKNVAAMTWMVFKDAIQISDAQLDVFRSLMSNELKPDFTGRETLGDNNRVPVDIPGLHVFCSAPQTQLDEKKIEKPKYKLPWARKKK